MLKLMLVDNGRVLFELPLSAGTWDRRKLTQEFEDFERDHERVSNLFSAFSNEGRIRMMSAFFERADQTLAFTELMNMLDMNPKLVWESTRRLRRVGIIEKDNKGRYRPTREGEAQFLMASIMLRKLLGILEEL